ncbi:hypothetical protein FHT71_003562 [Rhizobium sp. BK060]|nr:hypothetical protein [Rhizobium sp. BK060]
MKMPLTSGYGWRDMVDRRFGGFTFVARQIETA